MPQQPKPLGLDLATGNVNPGTVNGHVINLPVGATVNGVAIGTGTVGTINTVSPLSWNAGTSTLSISGVIPVANLGTGTPSSTTFLNGAGAWTVPYILSLKDATDLTKQASFDLSNIATATTRTINIPNANSTTAQTKAVVASNWLTGMSAQGVFSAAQPTFTDLAAHPTTIGGYGITDLNSLGDARWSLLAHTHTFASLTSKPTTLSGYGITDAVNLVGSLSQFSGGSYAFRDIAQLAIDGVDTRLVGKTAGATAQNLFSTRNDGSSTYVRSATHIAADADLTGLGVYTSSGFVVTAITADAVLYADHTSIPDGATVRFVTANNVAVNRTITSSQQVGSTDIHIGILSSALPSTITPVKILSTTAEARLLSAPLFYTDLNQQIFVAELSTVAATDVIAQAGTSPRSTFWKSGGQVTGDSSHPVFFIVDGVPALLFTFNSPVSSNSVAYNVTGINAALVSLGSANSLSVFPVSLLNTSDTPGIGGIPTITSSGKLSASILPSTPPAFVVQTVTATSGAVTIANGTDAVLLAPSGGVLVGPITFTMPLAVNFPSSGRIVLLDPQRVVSTPTNVINATRAGSDTINGSTSAVLWTNATGSNTASVASDGVSKLSTDQVVRLSGTNTLTGTYTGGTVSPTSLALPYNGTTLHTDAGSSGTVSFRYSGTVDRTIKFPIVSGTSTLLADTNNLSDLASAATARTNLGVAIGTNVQAWDTDLDSWAAITRGTGFDTATAINIGSAGAFVTNGGALGTPSSGTLTNATGLPISTGVSGLGSNVAAWLATPSVANFKSALSDETTVVGNLLSLANPGAISFIKIAADNTVSTRTPSQLASDLTLVIGTDVQAYDSDLTTWAATTPPSSYAVGDLLYASAANTLSKLADVATGSVLVSGGVTTAPAYSSTPSLSSLTLTGTTSLLLGTAGSAVGNIGFRNATSGTATLAPPTGALGTYTVTLPNAASTIPIATQQITWAGPTAARTYTLPDAAATLARTDAANTFTGASTATSWVFTTPVLGAASATSLTLTNGGAITDGGTGAINLAASGTNQPITLTPSGTGTTTISNGKSTGIFLNDTVVVSLAAEIYYDAAAAFARTGNKRQIYVTGGATPQVQLADNGLIAWSVNHGQGTGDAASGRDTVLSRNGAGILQFGTTTANTAGSWLATNGTLSGTLAVTGASTLTGVRIGYVAKTGAYTLTTTDYTVQCTSGTFAITLPTAVGVSGQIYVVKNSGTGVITLNTTSSQTIDNSASGAITLAQWVSYTLQSDGANWMII